MDFRDSHEILFNLHQITKIAAVYWTKKADEVLRGARLRGRTGPEGYLERENRHLPWRAVEVIFPLYRQF